MDQRPKSRWKWSVTPFTRLQEYDLCAARGITLLASHEGVSSREVVMRIERFSFGVIRIDGTTHEHDVVIDRGKVGKRKKKASKKLRDAFGHTPLSLAEKIPWKCRRLVVGTGVYGGLPVMEEVKREAEHRDVDLVILPTAEAIETLKRDAGTTNAILHVTC
jgi:hypothetical protein